MYDEPCMAAVGNWSQCTCKLGGGARVRVVGNGRQECLAT